MLVAVTRRALSAWRAVAMVFAAACMLPAVASAAGPTHAEFVRQADFLCTQAAAQTKALGTAKTRAQVAENLRISIFIGQTLRSSTLAIPAPPADRPLIRRGMAAMANELAALRRARSALLAGENAAFQADLRRAKAAHAKAVAAARTLGLKACT